MDAAMRAAEKIRTEDLDSRSAAHWGFIAEIIRSEYAGLIEKIETHLKSNCNTACFDRDADEFATDCPDCDLVRELRKIKGE